MADGSKELSALMIPLPVMAEAIPCLLPGAPDAVEEEDGDDPVEVPALDSAARASVAHRPATARTVRLRLICILVVVGKKPIVKNKID